MLDQLDLVHMNGRIYDPLMARFLSADPMIQDPAHSQSYNRYTYVWNNPTNLTDPTGFRAADTGDLLFDTLTFLKSGLGFTESKSEPANEKPTTGGADNSGGQGKSSQTVTVTGSLAQARAEQWLLAKTVEVAYGKDSRVIKEPIIKLGARVAVRTGWRMTAGAFSGPAAPFVEGALIIGGVYELGKGIYDIVKKNEGGDTSAEEALSGASSGTSTSDPKAPPQPGEIPTLDWNDPTKPPIGPNGEEWVWRGKPPQGGDKGGYVNPSNPDQSAHPDLAHPAPVGPHWDYTDRNKDNPGWRVYPGGKIDEK